MRKKRERRDSVYFANMRNNVPEIDIILKAFQIE
jgi:hypothetical protein